MAIRDSDGSIILETKIDTTGIRKGTNDIKSATEHTRKSVRNLSAELTKALNSGDTKTAQLINNFKKATNEVERQSAKVDELRAKLSGLQSGEIKVDGKGTSKLQNDFERTNATIETTKSKISEVEGKIETLVANAFRGPGGNIVFTPQEEAQLNKLDAELNELTSRLETSKLKAEELGAALKSATDTSTQAEIQKTKTQLADAESKLQNLSTKAEIAGTKLNGNMSNYRKEVSASSKALTGLGSRIGRLAASALIFSAITKAFTELRQTIGTMLMSNEQFRNSVYMLQAALWTLAQPIYEAVLPALQSMMNWLIKAILYVATFFSALGGKSITQTIRNAKALNKQANAYKSVASASKEARKQLAAFDEINILQDGNAGAGVNLSGINNSFDDLESLLSDSDMQNLKDFEQWVMENKDAIKVALEIAGLGLLGLAIGNVISNIGSLLGWFKKKDKGLDTQTKKTQTETSAVRELSGAWKQAPAYAYGFVPALEGLTATGRELIPVFDNATDTTYGFSPALEGATADAYELTPAIDGVTESAINLSPSIQTATDDTYAWSPAINVATESARALSPAVQTATDAITNLDGVVSESAPNVERNIETSFDNANTNIKTFSTESDMAVRQWAENIATNAESSTTNMAENVYKSFSNMGQNISDFVTSSSTNFANWAGNLAKNMADLASNISTNFGTALSAVWTDFQNLRKAMGEKVTTFWNKNKAGIITAGVFAGLLATGILLAPYTGGASLALPALASGGIAPHATTAIIGEKGKEAVLPLENNTEWMDILADRILMRGGNINVGGNTEVVLEMDGKTFGRAVVEQGNRANRRIGTRLVMV